MKGKKIPAQNKLSSPPLPQKSNAPSLSIIFLTNCSSEAYFHDVTSCTFPLICSLQFKINQQNGGQQVCKTSEQ